jgi:hypothetical protein
MVWRAPASALPEGRSFDIGAADATSPVFRGLTGEGLVARTGLSRRRLEQIEAGIGLRVSADDLVAIARTLEWPE